MAANHDSSQPLLPPELEQSIFELTARTFPGNAYNFAVVSRRVQVWMENYLYDIVTISNEKLCKHFLYAIKCRPPSFFAATVKSLCIPGDIDVDQALQILTVCQGVVNLAYWINEHRSFSRLRSKDHFSAISSLMPERLSINTGGLFGSSKPPDLTHPFFSQVTHLEIVDWPWPVISTAFELLPSLTHLAVDLERYDAFTIDKLRRIFESCSHLRVLLCLVEDEETMINAASAFASLDSDYNGRLVILSDSDVIGNWEGSLFGNSDRCQWTFAEALVMAKRGYIA